MRKTIVNDDAILAALLTSDTRKEAAEKAGVSERTLYNKMNNVDFNIKYAKARKSLVNKAAFQIQRALSTSISELRKIVEKGAKDSDRISAARALLEYGLSYTELSEIKKQIAELEKLTGKGDDNEI